MFSSLSWAIWLPPYHVIHALLHAMGWQGIGLGLYLNNTLWNQVIPYSMDLIIFMNLLTAWEKNPHQHASIMQIRFATENKTVFKLGQPTDSTEIANISPELVCARCVCIFVCAYSCVQILKWMHARMYINDNSQFILKECRKMSCCILALSEKHNYECKIYFF